MKMRNTFQPINESTMTPDALAALDKAGLSRRSFLKGTGALIVSFSAAGLARKLGVDAVAMAQQMDPRDKLDTWIAIAENGQVFSYTGKVELGQGILTAQMQIVAEELYVPFDRVTMIQGDTAYGPNGEGTPDQGTTAGSQSHPTNFSPLSRNRSLLTAAATAREALLGLAAGRLSVPVDQLSIRDGVIFVTSNPSQQATYAELIGGRQFSLPMNNNAPLKDPNTWTIRGTSVPRVEIPGIVTATHDYVFNVRVPGMVHGRVVRPPFVDGTVVSVDNQSEVESLPGNVKVVRKGNFIGVVADTQWAAIKAVAALRVTWAKPANPLPDQATFYDWLRRQPSSHNRPVDTSVSADGMNSGLVDRTLAEAKAAGRLIEATYLQAYNMHASMGASVGVADVKGEGSTGTATIWSGTQGVYNNLRAPVARIINIPEANIRVIFKQGAGCYGLKGSDAAAFDAALLSQAVGKPVRVQLTRQDEMAWENYGPAYVHDQRIAIDEAGNIIAWDSEGWNLGKGGRPSGNNPGNVVTGELVGLNVGRVNPSTTIPNPPANVGGNGSNFIPSYVRGAGTNGTSRYLGKVGIERVIIHTIPSPFFTGPLRSPNRLENTFVHECIIDEVAAKVGADPVEYRLRHLNDVPVTAVVSGERLKECLRAVAEAANWDTRPSPKPGNPRTGVVTGRGIACCLYEGDNGYCAVVAEVEVDQDTGVVIATRFVNSHDCGPITNPNGVQNQMEGGIYQGMSRALAEEVTWDNEKVTSIDWITYPVQTFGRVPTPKIENVLIDRRDLGQKAMGAGETTITCVAAAIANAIFDATGARVRELPMTPARVKAVLDARA
jgi:CO/xanthine dehydrogenase Mo-binding subunit